MPLAPAVEPCGIVLAAHERTVCADLAELLKRALRIRSEVHHGQKLGDEAVGQVVRGIAAERRDVESGTADGLVLPAHVILVVAPETVFVLHLDHEDVATVGDLAVLERLADGVEIFARGLEVALVAGAKADAVLPHEIPRKTAELPLRAGVGAGAENHPHALLLRHAAELRHIALAGEVVLAADALVVVPEHIGAHGVEAAGLDHLDAVAPEGARNAGEVHLTATDDERLPVKEKRLRSHLKGMLAGDRLGAKIRGRQKTADKSEQNLLHVSPRKSLITCLRARRAWPRARRHRPR